MHTYPMFQGGYGYWNLVRIQKLLPVFRQYMDLIILCRYQLNHLESKMQRASFLTRWWYRMRVRQLQYKLTEIKMALPPGIEIHDEVHGVATFTGWFEDNQLWAFVYRHYEGTVNYICPLSYAWNDKCLKDDVYLVGRCKGWLAHGDIEIIPSYWD